MNGKCHHICDNKTPLGYCQTTVCINPKYNGSGTYLITGIEDGWIKVDKRVWNEYKMMKDPDYGVGIYS